MARTGMSFGKVPGWLWLLIGQKTNTLDNGVYLSPGGVGVGWFPGSFTQLVNKMWNHGRANRYQVPVRLLKGAAVEAGCVAR